MSETGPIDIDINELSPGVFARLQVSRALEGELLKWAEIGYDNIRYQRSHDYELALLGMIESLLTVIAIQASTTPKGVWQQIMLNEARQDDETNS